MLKHLVLIIVSTFVFGFASGVIVYLLSSTGEGRGGLDERTGGFVVVGRVYGVCQTEQKNNCPAYRVTGDGAYTFRFVDSTGTQQQVDGELSESDAQALKDGIDESDFESLQSTKFFGTCPASAGGVAFKYDIENAEMRYTFDSCVQKISTEKIFKLLESYFVVFTEKYVKKD